jgi:hypothetical protein
VRGSRDIFPYLASKLRLPFALIGQSIPGPSDCEEPLAGLVSAYLAHKRAKLLSSMPEMRNGSHVVA